MAHATEFIEEMPNGLETVIGERGVRLSGGQRQRISIARALLKNAPILVLDEATSNVDVLTELAIQEALQTLMKDAPPWLSAHRFSTITQRPQRCFIWKTGPDSPSSGTFDHWWRREADIGPHGWSPKPALRRFEAGLRPTSAAPRIWRCCRSAWDRVVAGACCYF